VPEVAQAEGLEALDGADQRLHLEAENDLAQHVLAGLAALALDALEHDQCELGLQLVIVGRHLTDLLPPPPYS
jgi:hypothetical protein